MVWAMSWARVVLPVPGGPQKMTDDSRSASIRARSGRPGARRWSWPTTSSRVAGRSRAARGAWRASRSLGGGGEEVARRRAGHGRVGYRLRPRHGAAGTAAHRCRDVSGCHPVLAAAPLIEPWRRSSSAHRVGRAIVLGSFWRRIALWQDRLRGGPGRAVPDPGDELPTVAARHPQGRAWPGPRGRRHAVAHRPTPSVARSIGSGRPPASPRPAPVGRARVVLSFPTAPSIFAGGPPWPPAGAPTPGGAGSSPPVERPSRASARWPPTARPRAGPNRCSRGGAKGIAHALSASSPVVDVVESLPNRVPGGLHHRSGRRRRRTVGRRALADELRAAAVHAWPRTGRRRRAAWPDATAPSCGSTCCSKAASTWAGLDPATRCAVHRRASSSRPDPSPPTCEPHLRDRNPVGVEMPDRAEGAGVPYLGIRRCGVRTRLRTAS